MSIPLYSLYIRSMPLLQSIAILSDATSMSTIEFSVRFLPLGYHLVLMNMNIIICMNSRYHP
jgi:hypothetical protein